MTDADAHHLLDAIANANAIAKEAIIMRDAARAECSAQRESIAAYLDHISRVQVGNILGPESRQIVAFCASWVRNRLDEKWHRDMRGRGT